MYKVVFLNESGKRVAKMFDSPYFARQFVNKVRRSKKLRLLYCPLFD